MAAAISTSHIPSSMANSPSDSALAKPTHKLATWNEPGSESSKKLASSGVSDTVSAMAREISAGGVVLRRIAGVWHVALIEPQKSEPEKNEPHKEPPKPAPKPGSTKPGSTRRRSSRALITLPQS